MSNKSDLLREIQERPSQAESEQTDSKPTKRPRPKPATRAAINKANAQHSTGPKSPVD